MYSTRGDFMGFISSLFKHEPTGIKKQISITGMTCQHCVKHVKEALQQIQGVKKVDVSLAAGQANVIIADDVTDDMMKQAVEEAGYQVTSIH